MTPLEDAVLDASDALHASRFGEQLRAYRRERRSPDFASELAMYEIGGGTAPIIRTSSIVAAMRAANPTPPSLAGEDEYLQWIESASEAMNRVSTRLWDVVLPLPRQLIIDEDDLPQWATGYLAGGRYDRSSHGLTQVGFSPGAIRSIGVLAEQLSSTPCYQAARTAAATIAGDRALREELQEARQRFFKALPPKQPETLGDARSRTLTLVGEAYGSCGDSAQHVARAIRGLNDLINCLGWILLCGAEADEGVPDIESEAQALRATHTRRSLVIRFSTTENIGWVSPPCPVRLALATPLDGLYLVRMSRVQMTARALHDIEAWSLRELETAP